jgi:hypothetical protein
LIAAYWLANDTNFLKEAALKYPNDPRVQFQILGANLFTEDRRLWLEAFKKSAPDNALANYLAARKDFKAEKPEAALAELTNAQGKPVIDVYWQDRAQAVAEAYITAGFASPDAHLESLGYSFSPPNVSIELRKLNFDIIEHATQSRQSGDTATADTLIAAGLALGTRLTMDDTGKLVIDELLGSAIQMLTLKSVDSSVPIEFAGTTQTAGERLASLQTRRDAIGEVIGNNVMGEKIATMISSLGDDDRIVYFEHVRKDGEFAAIQWLRDKLGPNLPPQPSASDRK